MINETEKAILVIFFLFFCTVHVGLFTTSCAGFSLFYVGNVILFQIKVNARNIKETTPARYFIKVTACPSFTQLREIKWRNRVQIWIWKYEIC